MKSIKINKITGSLVSLSLKNMNLSFLKQQEQEQTHKLDALQEKLQSRNAEVLSLKSTHEDSKQVRLFGNYFLSKLEGGVWNPCSISLACMCDFTGQ